MSSLRCEAILITNIFSEDTEIDKEDTDLLNQNNECYEYSGLSRPSEFMRKEQR